MWNRESRNMFAQHIHIHIKVRDPYPYDRRQWGLSAEGIESTLKRTFNGMQVNG
jgi:hypothetical protein